VNVIQANWQILNTLFLIVSFVAGATIGSFLNVCIYRLPRNESIVRPRSRCPKCGNAIAWFDNIPIVSWLLLGAKCRYCHETISWQYPLVEALTGALFACVFWRFGFTVATFAYMLLTAALILVTFVDLTEWIIPDQVTVPGIFIGLALSLLGMFYAPANLVVTDVFDSLIGMVLGGASLYLLDKITVLLLRKPGMGFGDVKLLAMLGAFLGWKNVVLIIMTASLVGSVIGIAIVLLRRRKGTETSALPDDMPKGHYIPFGPYLALAGLFAMFFGADLINFYLNRLSAVPGVEQLPLIQ